MALTKKIIDEMFNRRKIASLKYESIVDGEIFSNTIHFKLEWMGSCIGSGNWQEQNHMLSI